MARASSPDPIDRLYQVPLADFTAERNALAKSAGTRAADVRTLQKPSVPAWAVNQLYWQQREVYDALIERAEDLRATHTAALKGKRADLRGASRAHDEAVDHALKTTLELLADGGHPVTDATRQAIATTLRGLPGDEAPGRLTRPLQPRGFEMLGGAPAQGRVRVAPAPARTKPPARPSSATKADKGEERRQAAAKLAAAREALAAATRETREAEQATRREEFEAARAAREAEKAGRRVGQAEEAVAEAQRELDDARREAAAAAKARDAAQARAARASDVLDGARERERQARTAVEDLS